MPINKWLDRNKEKLKRGIFDRRVLTARDAFGPFNTVGSDERKFADVPTLIDIAKQFAIDYREAHARATGTRANMVGVNMGFITLNRLYYMNMEFDVVPSAKPGLEYDLTLSKKQRVRLEDYPRQVKMFLN